MRACVCVHVHAHNFVCVIMCVCVCVYVCVCVHVNMFVSKCVCERMHTHILFMDVYLADKECIVPILQPVQCKTSSLSIWSLL